ncbi:MAG: DUF1643 domain-containing protein [Gammaproteobacteria bacterium]|nr:DUF1643 domain-containing protein [Gammaproteobacteria bacterium]
MDSVRVPASLMPLVSQIRYRHFDQVDRERIRAYFSCLHTHRWALEVPYRRDPARTQTVSVFLKNPSSASEEFADKTIQTVEREIYRLFPTAAWLWVFNLFGMRATKARDVRRAIDRHGIKWTIGRCNDRALLRAIRGSDHIVAAWGAQSSLLKADYDERVEQVGAMLHDHRRKFWYVGRLSKKHEHPRHGQRCKSTDQAQRFPNSWRWWPGAAT